MYKLGPDLYITYWLSTQTHTENRCEETGSCQLSINTTEAATKIIACMRVWDIHEASLTWPENRCNRNLGVKHSRCKAGHMAKWTFRDMLTIMDGVSMKCRWIIILPQLQPKTMKQPHNYYMAIEKARLLSWLYILSKYELKYQRHKNDIQTCMELKQMQAKIPHEILGKPLETMGVDIFALNNSNFIRCCKIICTK